MRGNLDGKVAINSSVLDNIFVLGDILNDLGTDNSSLPVTDISQTGK